MPTPEDFAAYRRMRKRGLWPEHIEGCAAIEATATYDNLSWGQGLTEEQIAEQKEVVLLMEELGLA
jgi:hypothetical protein